MLLIFSSALAAPALPSLDQRLSAILERNLFNAERGSHSGCTYTTDPEARLPAALVGTLVTKPVEYSSALVSIREGTLVAVSIGDTLLDMEVHAIETHRITLRSATGERSSLTMKAP